MINVVYDREHHSVTVKGHAMSDEPGKDLVCAAASALTYTLAANVSELSADRNKVRRPVIKLDEGDAVIKCSPVHGTASVVTLIFDSVCMGFRVLSIRYPEYISYVVQG